MAVSLFDFTDVTHLSTTEKGTTHEAPALPSTGLILGFRKKGTVNGNHWHAGKVVGKSPEHFFLLEGSMEAYGRHLDTNDELTRVIEAPQIVKIHPRVFHRFTALTDCRFMEFNSIKEHEQDTFYQEPKTEKGSG
mgnify:CR=1 FL=1